jgi:hypothetical protein
MPRVEHPKNQRAAALDGRADDLACTVEARTQVRGSQKTAAKPPSSPQLSSDISPEDTENYRAFIKELGTTDGDFAEGLVAQLLNVSARGSDKFHSRELFFALAVIRSSKPRDELDAMQVAQMAAIHEATMRAAGEVPRAECQVQKESAIRP